MVRPSILVLALLAFISGPEVVEAAGRHQRHQRLRHHEAARKGADTNHDSSENDVSAEAARKGADTNHDSAEDDVSAEAVADASHDSSEEGRSAKGADIHHDTSEEDDSDEDGDSDDSEADEGTASAAAPASAPPAAPFTAQAGPANESVVKFPPTEKWKKEHEDWLQKIEDATMSMNGVHEKLEENLRNQKILEAKIADIEDEDENMLNIDRKVSQVGQELGTQHMANMLGDMWKDMRMFSSPFLLEKLDGELASQQANGTALQLEYKAAKEEKERLEWGMAAAAEKAMKEWYRKGESEKPKAAPKPAAAAASPAAADASTTEAASPAAASSSPKRARAEAADGGDYEAFYTTETMPRVSPAVKCVIILACQYFIIYTALAILRTANLYTHSRFMAPQKVLQSATATVTYAPMLAILFLGARMRAIQLTQGETEKYGLPQGWVQTCMYACTFAVLGQTIMVLVLPFVTGEWELPISKVGDTDLSNTRLKRVPFLILTAIRYLLMAMLYGGFVAVIIGCFQMTPPKEIWGDEEPPVSPAVFCTMILTTVFFLAYLGVAVVQTAIQFGGKTQKLTKLEGAFTMARYSVNLAPMTCVLFIAARMRALQIDPMHGAPQQWAQRAFYASTVSITLQAILVVVLPMAMGCEVQEGKSEGEVIFRFQVRVMTTIATILRYTFLLCLYGGTFTVVVSIFLIKHREDPSKTPPISPAVQCVVMLTSLYFLAYTALFVCQTVQQYLPRALVVAKLVLCFEAGTKTVMFAPMLAILFIAARLRALQLTKATNGEVPPDAGPQSWAQEGMFLSSWAVMLQFVIVCTVPWAMGGDRIQTTTDGMYKPPQGSKISIVLDVVAYLSMLAMYGGAVVVMYAIFTMTPETLPPYASYEGLVPGVKVPPPATPAF